MSVLCLSSMVPVGYVAHDGMGMGVAHSEIAVRVCMVSRCLLDLSFA